MPVILNQDVPTASGFDGRGVDLGDISLDAGIGKTIGRRLVLVGGVLGTLPTTPDEAIGLERWLLGLEAFVWRVRPWGVLGLLVTHQ